MTSKSDILKTLRGDRLADVELPEITGDWITYENPREQFCQVLEAVGGRAISIGGPAEAARVLEQSETFRQAENVWSLVPEIASRGRDWDQVEDPHELDLLDYCIVPGEFGVAENGAVWVSQQAPRHRAALFITQHLVLVVAAADLVQHMHAAYQRLSWADAPFGIFISGPSKTADIEQSLVIGAHGARSLTVLLTETS